MAFAKVRETGRTIMMKSDLTPPEGGLNADPLLYGVAACLAEMFPPVTPPRSPEAERDADGAEADGSDDG